LEPGDLARRRTGFKSFCLSMIFSENRFTLFRIMLQQQGAK
jgi:hypothetical protein